MIESCSYIATLLRCFSAFPSPYLQIHRTTYFIRLINLYFSIEHMWLSPLFYSLNSPMKLISVQLSNSTRTFSNAVAKPFETRSLLFWHSNNGLIYKRLIFVSCVFSKFNNLKQIITIHSNIFSKHIFSICFILFQQIY